MDKGGRASSVVKRDPMAIHIKKEDRGQASLSSIPVAPSSCPRTPKVENKRGREALSPVSA